MPESSITADAIVHKVIAGNVTTQAIVYKVVTGSLTADSIIQKTIAGSVTTQAIVQLVQTGSITAKAVLVRGITARAIIFKTQTGSITTKAYVAWYSDYPTSITAWTDLADVDPAVNDSGSWFNKDFMDKVTVNVAATQTEWGANPQGVYATVAERVAALEQRALVMRFGNITAQAEIA